MKKILYAVAALAACLVFSQCKDDYLSVSSPDKSDDTFVTSSVSETFKTLAWCYGTYRSVAGGGNYNWADYSECDYYPEYNSNNARIGFLRPLDLASADWKKSQIDNLYSILARCARIGGIIEDKDEYTKAVKEKSVNDWTQLHGEAWTMWAYCYFELVRHCGDTPFGLENSVVEEYSLTSRFDILDACIKKLEEVADEMYNLGEGGIQAERMSRTFAYELLGECAMYSGGYQTIRTDVDGLYGDLSFDKKYENTAQGAAYARRSDWKTYYTKAQTSFRTVVSGKNKGSLSLITADNRSYADNPFQRGFQYVMDMEISPESIWEVGNLAPNQSERPYSQGRPSNGGNSNAAPCKVFGGIRVNPIFYYTGYEDGDKRWDASAVVTGSDGKGNEKLVDFKSGSKCSGGIAVNKWDISKMASPYVIKCRNSGMNYALFRLPITMLQLAEVDAALGEDAEALSMLNQLRTRSGIAELKGVSGDKLINAVVDEFRRETLGEGNTKYAEIRAGVFTESAKAMRAEMKKMIAGIEADGYYTFANGRTISAYIWTKSVHKDKPLTYDAVDSDPALTPGWRGIYDYSTIATVASVVTGTNHNLAIQGLFKYIKPGSAEAQALEADGYVKTDWANNIVSGKDQLWDYNMLSGIDLSDVPLYYTPIPQETIKKSNGKVTNGYGLPQQ